MTKLKCWDNVAAIHTHTHTTETHTMNNRIEFLLSSRDELAALVSLIRALNEEGVTFWLRKDTISIELTISDRF